MSASMPLKLVDNQGYSAFKEAFKKERPPDLFGLGTQVQPNQVAFNFMTPRLITPNSQLLYHG